VTKLLNKLSNTV